MDGRAKYWWKQYGPVVWVAIVALLLWDVYYFTEMGGGSAVNATCGYVTDDVVAPLDDTVEAAEMTMDDVVAGVETISSEDAGQEFADEAISLDTAMATSNATVPPTLQNFHPQIHPSISNVSRAFVITVMEASDVEAALLQVEAIKLSQAPYDTVVMAAAKAPNQIHMDSLQAQQVAIYTVNVTLREHLHAASLRLANYEQVILPSSDSVLEFGWWQQLEASSSTVIKISIDSDNYLYMLPTGSQVESLAAAYSQSESLDKAVKLAFPSWEKLVVDKAKLKSNLSTRGRLRAFMLLRHLGRFQWSPYASAVDVVNGPVGKNMPKLPLQIIPNICFPSAVSHCIVSNNDSDVNSAARTTTATVQLSMDRFSRLQQLSREWTGPISAAIWVPLAEVRATILFLLTEQYDREQVDIHLVLQRGSKPYPINALRNIAVRHANTDMVFLLDLDFIPSSGLYQRLQSDKGYEHVWTNSMNKHVFVVPAFEFMAGKPCQTSYVADEKRQQSSNSATRCYNFPRRKSELIRLLRSGNVARFHPRLNGHLYTNNGRWMSPSQPYYIQWGEWYEPYLLLRKSQIDFNWFDDRFFDRGRNKCIFAFELYVRGYAFVVLPDDFTIHHWEDRSGRLKLYKPMMSLNEYLYKYATRNLRRRFQCPLGRGTCYNNLVKGKYGDYTPKIYATK